MAEQASRTNHTSTHPVQCYGDPWSKGSCFAEMLYIIIYECKELYMNTFSVNRRHRRFSHVIVDIRRYSKFSLCLENRLSISFRLMRIILYFGMKGGGEEESQRQNMVDLRKFLTMKSMRISRLEKN